MCKVKKNEKWGGGALMLIPAFYLLGKAIYQSNKAQLSVCTFVFVRAHMRVCERARGS